MPLESRPRLLDALDEVVEGLPVLHARLRLGRTNQEVATPGPRRQERRSRLRIGMGPHPEELLGAVHLHRRSEVDELFPSERDDVLEEMEEETEEEAVAAAPDPDAKSAFLGDVFRDGVVVVVVEEEEEAVDGLLKLLLPDPQRRNMRV